ncbi:MAG: cation:proton antiporter [Gammaproteobacteria bacterium]|nr:cation:proton antiporter [Gammaproteobacteria bacterium]
MDPIIIVIALLLGLASRAVGYPPLLGYLVAGFAAAELGFGDAVLIGQVADLGVTLLLFTIGLKLDLRQLAEAPVWGSALAHMAIVVVLTVPTILLISAWFPSLSLASDSGAWTLAFALSFSSTVFAVKMFDERGENAALHATLAIGILVIQDLLAVGFLVLSADYPPSIWALALLLLPLARPLLNALLSRAGHGELLVLFGVAVALGFYGLFEAVQLKGGLGALVAGVLIGRSRKSSELYKSLVSLKDLFLLGFFLQIGFYGLPSLEMVVVAVLLTLLVLLRPLTYYALLVMFRFRARTAFITGLSLFNYSEFGLIVGAIAVSAGLLSQAWLTTLALAMVLSFFLATPFNTRVHALYARYSETLHRLERKKRRKTERFADLGDASVVVLGMGRVGLGAYELALQQLGPVVVGVEENIGKVKQLAESGIHCVVGDAADYDFWLDAKLAEREMLMLCLSNHRENMTVIDLAREMGFKGKIAVATRFADQEAELHEHGCITYNIYADVGRGFAEHVLEQGDLNRSSERVSSSAFD